GMPGVALDPSGGSVASWRLPHASVEVEGNHFSMMLDHAEGTAEAVLAVLASQVKASGDRNSNGRRETE
ncbi:MAG: hypothetical protein ACRDLL_16245, partial [Solirubrobacterales bacterium]